MNIKDMLDNLLIDCTDEELYDFESYALKTMWDGYIQQRMDKTLVIKNQIEALSLSFPNGTAGKRYKVSGSMPMDFVDYFWFEGLEQLGLQSIINEVTGGFEIVGTASVAGTFTFKICYKQHEWIKGMPILARSFTVAINPDPKTLWKNIPTNPEVEYYQPDSECEYVKVEEMDGRPQKDIVVASQRGRSHAHEGNPRDDHYKVKYVDENGWYILAVADGAGSAKYSRKGSTLACEAAVKHCFDFLSDEQNVARFESHISGYSQEPNDESRKLLGDDIYHLVGSAAFKGFKAIEQEAQNHDNAPMKYYATTLLLSVCKRFEFGWFVASFWVGDGAMCIYDKDRQYFKLLGSPDEGEFAGQTRFLTMPDIFRDATSFYGRLKFSIEQDFTALFLMTDGVSDPMFETDANLNKIEKWNDLYENITQSVELVDDNESSKDQLLKWLDFWSQGNHDDRTIAILY